VIAQLTGMLIHKSPEYLVVDVHGVGYQVFVPLSSFYRLPDIKETVTLEIHTYVRENILQLYGFLSYDEKSLFLLFLGVSGIGPKLALNILAGLEPSELIAALQAGEVTRLVRIPGVGPKTAGRLILELKEKLLPFTKNLSVTPGQPADTVREDALSALVNLGYSPVEAKRVVDRAVEAVNGEKLPLSVEVLIKISLRLLVKAG